MELKVKRIDKTITLPAYIHKGDAGFDLRSAEDLVIKSGEKAIVPTGLKFMIPEGYAGLIWDRSGLAAKNSLHCLAGVIDSHFRGETKIVLFNLGKEDFHIEKGMRIAQMLIQKIESPEIIEVEELDATERGSGGFGSTGLH